MSSRKARTNSTASVAATDPVAEQIRSLRHLYGGAELAQKVSFRLGKSITIEQIEQILNQEPDSDGKDQQG